MAKTPRGPITSVDPTGEFPFDASDYVLHLLQAICQFRDAALDHALRSHELNVGRYRVLGVLAFFGATSMTELANFTAMDRTTLTRIADTLVGRGWVVRIDSPTDRRQVLLELTTEGRATHREGMGAVLDFNRQLLDGVSDNAKRVTARTLMAVVERVAPNGPARDSIIRYRRENRESA